MRHCSFGVMNTASQLLKMLATMAVSIVGIGRQADIPTVSVIFTDLLENVPTIDRIRVRLFRYHITELMQFSRVLCFIVSGN